MTTRARILLLESSRYRALLLHRALSVRIPEAIIVRFIVAEPALEELNRGAYAAAIINLDALSRAQLERLSVELKDQPTCGPILLMSPDTPRRTLTLLAELDIPVLMNITAAPELVADQLVLRISQRSQSLPPARPRTALLPTQLALHGQ